MTVILRTTHMAQDLENVFVSVVMSAEGNDMSADMDRTHGLWFSLLGGLSEFHAGIR